MDSLAEDLLRELECPICMEYQVPPIILCKNGHNICNSCEPSLRNCPMCGGCFVDVRCRLIENMSRKLTHPCKYKKSGCTGHFLVDFKEQHENECLYSPHKCPFVITGQCTWVGPLLHMKEHVTTTHVLELIGPEKIKSTIKKKENEIIRDAVLTFDGLFFFYAKSNGNLVQMMVMFVGFEEEAKRYKYKVTIETPDGAQSVSACLMCSSYIQFIEKPPKLTDVSAVFHSSFYNTVMDQYSHVPFKYEILKSTPEE